MDIDRDLEREARIRLYHHWRFIAAYLDGRVAIELAKGSIRQFMRDFDPLLSIDHGSTEDRDRWQYIRGIIRQIQQQEGTQCKDT